MAGRGKVPESEALKKVFTEYLALNEDEQNMFRSKAFTKLCSGISNSKKEEIKKMRKDLLKAIKKAVKDSSKIIALADIPTEVLKEVLAEREKAAK